MRIWNLRHLPKSEAIKKRVEAYFQLAVFTVMLLSGIFCMVQKNVRLGLRRKTDLFSRDCSKLYQLLESLTKNEKVLMVCTCM